MSFAYLQLLIHTNALLFNPVLVLSKVAVGFVFQQKTCKWDSLLLVYSNILLVDLSLYFAKTFAVFQKKYKPNHECNEGD